MLVVITMKENLNILSVWLCNFFCLESDKHQKLSQLSYSSEQAFERFSTVKNK
jgi:hypothetical protein